MPNVYNGETLVLPESESDRSGLSETGHYIFAVHGGRIKRFLINGTMRLGRVTNDSAPEIAIQNMFLSRSHGRFSTENGKVSYTAEETTNGIYLNGERIAAGTTVLLNDGDELVIPTGRTMPKKNDIMLKCAFSPRNISLWSSMTEAQLDELTGLPGRRLFSERFRTFRSGGRGEDWLFILDIDRFKQINDIYGHSAGDAALRVLSAVLLKPEYNISSPARWGGDEFVGLIRGNEETVVGSMNTLNDRLSSDLINNSFSIGISVGLCRINTFVKDLAALVEKADKALYRSKKSEKTKVNISE